MSDAKDESQNKKGKQKRISYTKCNRCGKRMKALEERGGPQLCEECKQKWKDQDAQGGVIWNDRLGSHKNSRYGGDAKVKKLKDELNDQ